MNPPETKQFLLLCVNGTRGCINLAQLDVTHIKHDEALFRRIRAAYANLRGLKAWNPLIVPETIEYIQVRLFRIFLWESS